MPTRNVELPLEWTQIAVGPSYLSLSPNRSAKYQAASMQVLFATGAPDDGTDGHTVTGLTAIELNAGEILYGRARGYLGSLAGAVITDAAPAVRLNSFRSDEEEDGNG